MSYFEQPLPNKSRVAGSKMKLLTREQFLKAVGAGSVLLAGCAMLGACERSSGDGGGNEPYGSPGGGAEFHGAYPYQLPPTGHFNSFAANAITVGIYWDLMEMPLAIYRWADQEYIPLLATNWGYELPDVYRVRLREGVTWSDGSEFNAKDIITTFDLLRLQNQVVWSYLGSVEADGDYGVVFEMKDPSTVVERYVLREHIRPDSVYGESAQRARQLFDRNVDLESQAIRDLRTQFEEFRPEEIVVSGPYKINKDSMTESQLTMEKFHGAYHAGDVKFDRIVLYNGEVPAVAPLVISRDVDYATHGFTLAMEKSFKEQGIEILRPPVYNGPGLWFNYAKLEAIGNPRVRQALAMAIDRQENAAISFGESSKPSRYMTGVSDLIIERWVSQKDLDTMNPYDFDPERAASMLDELGFEKRDNVWVAPNGEKMDYELGVPAEFYSEVARNVADQLTRFGVKTTVRTVTFTQWSTRIQNGQFQMGILDWGQGEPHPHFSYVWDFLTYNTQASGGGMSFDLTQITESGDQVNLDELAIQSASGLDEERQKEIVTRLARAFNELLPIIPIWERYGTNPVLDGERVTGWLPEGDPIYQNSPYTDSFVIIMMLDGTLKATGRQS